MNQRIDLENPNITAFATGELTGTQFKSFQEALGDLSVMEELRETEKMIALLRDCFQDEWQSNLEASLQCHQVTDYALDELSCDEMEAFEILLEESPETLQELDGVRDMMSLLLEAFEGEWRSQQPVNLDLPDFTNYALNEMSAGEKEQFEVLLKHSPAAKKEMLATRELVSLLSKGLEMEWKSELSATDHEFSLVEATGDENIISVNFARESFNSIRAEKIRGPVLISLAAVLAGLLVVGGLLRHAEGDRTVINGFSSDGRAWFDKGDQQAEVAQAPLESTLGLILLEELDEDQSMESFEFADQFAEDESQALGFVIPVSFPTEFEETSPSRHSAFQGGYVACNAQDSMIGGVSDQGILSLLGSSNTAPNSEIAVSQEFFEGYSNVQAELESVLLEVRTHGVTTSALQNKILRLLDLHKNLGDQIKVH